MAALIQHSWKAYHSCTLTHPILTKSGISGGLMAISDMLCQRIMDRDAPLDYRRTCILASYSCIMGGPVLHNWFKFLDKLLPSNSFKSTCGKLAIDQLGFAPVGLLCFFSYTSFMEGESLSTTKSKLNDHFVPTLKANYTVWPLVNMINFGLVPMEHRVLYLSSVSLLWNMYLSSVKYSNGKHNKR